MITNDRYIAELEKMAGDDSEDLSQVARREYNANRQDNRTYLGSLFSKANEVEQQMTAAAGRVLSQKNESGSPFIKVAARQIFEEMVAGSDWEKTASPAYREVTFHAFSSELSKLAALKPQTMAELAKKNQIANATPKTWSLSPISAGTKAALPQGSGTSLHQSGLLSRAAKAFGISK